MTTHTDATISSRANEIVLVLRCTSCGKRHRVREYPTTPSGLPAQHFLLTCIGCGKTEIRALADIVHYTEAHTAPSPTQAQQIPVSIPGAEGSIRR